ncbi:MAG: hypothetical protein R3F20_05715 [Planctomycetota bacterium]
MFHRRRTLTLLVLVALAAVFSRAGAGATPQDQFAEAERLFAEKSYRPAIEAFGAIFHDPSWPEITRAKALLRMAEANERIQQWDEAIRLLTDHESSVKIPIWHGRLLALRGSVALTMPTYYYEKDGVRTRGRWVQGGDYHHDEEANVVAALRDLEAAVVQLRPIVAGMGVVESDADRTTAEISSRAALQYAQALEAFRNSHGGFKNGIEPSDELVAAHEKFGVGRQLGTDPQAGYRIAEELAVATGLRANAALSRYLQAMYCGRLLEVVSGGVTVLPPDGDGPPMPKRGQVDPTDPDRTIWVALPESMNPFAIMKSLWRDYPGTDVEDDGYLAYANLAARYERYVEAERVASELLDRFPRSFWRSDAEALLQEIRFPMLQIEDPRPALPGEKVALSVSTRNVSKLRFQVWKFDLGGVLESRSYLRDDDANFAALAEIVKKSSQVGDRIGRPDQSFVRETPDRGEHRFREMEVPLDLRGQRLPHRG